MPKRRQARPARLPSQRASATVVAELITTQPAALTRLSRTGSGKPKWKLTLGLCTKKFTLIGLCVAARTHLLLVKQRNRRRPKPAPFRHGDREIGIHLAGHRRQHDRMFDLEPDEVSAV